MMVFLRRVQMEDMDLIYEWANDPVTRANSFQKETIPYEVHQQWFQGVMRDPEVILYILMDEQIPVGQIRIRVEGDTGEISYSIAPEHRGKGYGRKLLSLAEESIRRDAASVKKLIARVKPENAVSGYLFETEGFRKQYLEYEKEL
ncbi:MAG: GNAT family N-acetyltransferase [Eubacterium sp.]|nr:GNAT family N-acetyltransferase [Eubacterium sp.]